MQDGSNRRSRAIGLLLFAIYCLAYTGFVATAAFAGMLYVFLATNTECVELMNVALTHVVILAALCALPRATGYSDMCSTTTRV